MAYGDYGKTSELEAVNICLGEIGEQPVNAIPTSGTSKAILARDLLYEISREIQIKGLNCNTEVDYTLSPDESGHFVLPSNCLDVDPDNIFANYIERNGKLYDIEEHTYAISESTIDVTLVLFLPWTELPEHVRRYINIRAARIFQRRWKSDGDSTRFTEDDEVTALAEFQRKELNNADMSIFDNVYINRGVIRRFR